MKLAKQLDLVGFSYSDWASDPDDRKLTTSYCVYLGNNLITWCAKKQGTLSHSSIEAECSSLADVIAKLIWIESLLSELLLPIPRVPVV